MTLAERLAERGEIGGRTVQINERGEVECAVYPLAPLADGQVRVRTAISAVSPGTELTYVGRAATNPYLRKHWDPELRLFVDGAPTQDYPIVFGYRAAGVVSESRAADVPVGTRIFGKWRHTEYTVLAAADAAAQRLPDELTFDDGVDLAQMLTICVNAVSFGEDAHRGAPVVVFGCGPIGLIVAQIARATGAAAVYVVDRLPERLAIASGLGLETRDATVGDVALELKRQLGSEAVPVAFECSGNTRALHEAIRVVRRRGTVVAVAFECTGSTRALQEAIRTARRRGRVVAVGFYQGEAAGLFLGDEFHHNGVEIRSGQIGNLHPRWQAGELRAFGIELVRAKRITLGGLPRLRLPVDQAAAAFRALSAREVLQVTLDYSEAHPRDRATAVATGL